MPGKELPPENRPAAGRGALTCAAGLLLLALGAGIGLPHLAKTGLTPVALAGLAALVSGLVLMAVGARMMLRGRRWWVSAVVLPSLVILTAATLLTLGQAVAATTVPPLAWGL